MPAANNFEEWTNFTFPSPIAVVPDSGIFLYVLVYNDPSTGSLNATGLRMEFFDSSTFN